MQAIFNNTQNHPIKACTSKVEITNDESKNQFYKSRNCKISYYMRKEVGNGGMGYSIILEEADEHERVGLSFGGKDGSKPASLLGHEDFESSSSRKEKANSISCVCKENKCNGQVYEKIIDLEFGVKMENGIDSNSQKNISIHDSPNLVNLISNLCPKKSGLDKGFFFWLTTALNILTAVIMTVWLIFEIGYQASRLYFIREKKLLKKFRSDLDKEVLQKNFESIIGSSAIASSYSEATSNLANSLLPSKTTFEKSSCLEVKIVEIFRKFFEKIITAGELVQEMGWVCGIYNEGRLKALAYG